MIYGTNTRYYSFECISHGIPIMRLLTPAAWIVLSLAMEYVMIFVMLNQRVGQTSYFVITGLQWQMMPRGMTLDNAVNLNVGSYCCRYF